MTDSKLSKQQSSLIEYMNKGFQLWGLADGFWLFKNKLMGKPRFKVNTNTANSLIEKDLIERDYCYKYKITV